MSQMKLRGIDKEPKKKIPRRSKKKVSPRNSLRKLAGGWSRKEADEFLESLQPFDQIGTTTQE